MSHFVSCRFYRCNLSIIKRSVEINTTPPWICMVQTTPHKSHSRPTTTNTSLPPDEPIKYLQQFYKTARKNDNTMIDGVHMTHTISGWKIHWTANYFTYQKINISIILHGMKYNKKKNQILQSDLVF